MKGALTAKDEIQALREALAEMALILEDVAKPEPEYGLFQGGDPRAFKPDPECASPAQVECHKRACAEFASTGQIIGADFGLGSFYRVNPFVPAAIDHARDLLAKEESGGE